MRVAGKIPHQPGRLNFLSCTFPIDDSEHECRTHGIRVCGCRPTCPNLPRPDCEIFPGSGSYCGQQNGLRFSDHDRMLVMCRESSVYSFRCPPVFCLFSDPGTGCDNGLNGYHQSRMQALPGSSIVKIRHARCLVDCTSDAVATEFPDHTKSIGSNLALNGPAYFVDAPVRSRKPHRLTK
jgi:hypothetical protein